MYVAESAIGGLMHEHKLILRVIRDLRRELDRIAAEGEVDPAYIAAAVDFIRTYADRCHHGKEEDILFRDLSKKPLSDADRSAMELLLEDHKWARGKVRDLVDSTTRCELDPGAVGDVARTLEEIVEFYPGHIEREDHGFFLSARHYFDREELDAMAAECAAFERSLIHEKYLKVAEGLEARH